MSYKNSGMMGTIKRKESGNGFVIELQQRIYVQLA